MLEVVVGVSSFDVARSTLAPPHWGPDIFSSQNPGFAWLADCSPVSPLCKEAPVGHFLSENGRENRLLCCQATGLPALFSPVRERAGAEAWILGGKNVGTPSPFL